MHNFTPYRKASYHIALEDVKLEAGAETESFIDNHSASLTAAHQAFDTAASAGTLASLTSALSCPGKQKEFQDHEYWRTYNLFNSSLKYVVDHWTKLGELNGNSTLICPICGLEDCTEMDHYAPRSKFPEQSCHIGNLIPTCHTCNNKKRTKWKDTRGRQMIFNAFYDTKLPESILDYTLTSSPERDLLDVVVVISRSLNPTVPQHFRIISTIKELKLLKKFQAHASRLFKIKISEIRIRYSKTHSLYRDVDHFIETQKTVMEESISEESFIDFIDKDLMICIARKQEFTDYIKTILLPS